MERLKTKCDFCKYWTGQGCMVTPNSYYCREASDELRRYLTNKQKQPAIKSFRKWDKK
jgi:hypothetical protein